MSWKVVVPAERLLARPRFRRLGNGDPARREHLQGFLFRLYAFGVDKHGRGPADLEGLQDKLKLTRSDVRSDLDELAEAGLVHLYEVKGDWYFEIDSFDEDQFSDTIRKRGKSDYPARAAQNKGQESPAPSLPQGQEKGRKRPASRQDDPAPRADLGQANRTERNRIEHDPALRSDPGAPKEGAPEPPSAARSTVRQMNERSVSDAPTAPQAPALGAGPAAPARRETPAQRDEPRAPVPTTPVSSDRPEVPAVTTEDPAEPRRDDAEQTQLRTQLLGLWRDDPALGRECQWVLRWVDAWRGRGGVLTTTNIRRLTQRHGEVYVTGLEQALDVALSETWPGWRDPDPARAFCRETKKVALATRPVNETTPVEVRNGTRVALLPDSPEVGFYTFIKLMIQDAANEPTDPGAGGARIRHHGTGLPYGVKAVSLKRIEMDDILTLKRLVAWGYLEEIQDPKYGQICRLVEPVV